LLLTKGQRQVEAHGVIQGICLFSNVVTSNCLQLKQQQQQQQCIFEPAAAAEVSAKAASRGWGPLCTAASAHNNVCRSHTL
jgi:hypothetical protein